MNPVMKFQILARDPEAAAAFYGGVFGWTVQPADAIGYRAVDTNDARGIGGGIFPSPQNLTQLFIEVDDIDATIANATAAGAQVIFPKQVLPGGDAMAILLDPSGLPFGIYTPSSS